MRLILALFAIFLLATPTTRLAAGDDIRDVSPEKIQFSRQAVTRMVFDAGQNIPLASLRPAKVFELDLMHPELLPGSGIKWDIKSDVFVASSPQAASASQRWVGGFNPFATFDLGIQSATGEGSTGMTFRHSTKGNSLTAALLFKDGNADSIIWTVVVGGQ